MSSSTIVTQHFFEGSHSTFSTICINKWNLHSRLY